MHMFTHLCVCMLECVRVCMCDGVRMHAWDDMAV